VALPLRSLTPAAPDPILGLAESFKADTRPHKVNLSVGVYVDDSGVTPVIPSVLEAERRLLAEGRLEGLSAHRRPAGYKAAVRDLIFGPDHEIVTSGRSATAQTPGGTGALRVAADFLLQTGASKTIWLSEPTWPNHPQLFTLAGFAHADLSVPRRVGARPGSVKMLGALRSAVPATSSCSTARATTRAASIRIRRRGPPSGRSSSSASCCRSWTSPTRASASACARTPTGWPAWPGPVSSSSSARATRRTSRCTTSASGR
jgi:hypothetical protein